MTRQERRERVEALRTASEAELAKVLDGTQMNSYRDLDEGLRLGSQRNRAMEQRGATRPSD
jgi:hypothetical protein